MILRRSLEAQGCHAAVTTIRFQSRTCTARVFIYNSHHLPGSEVFLRSGALPPKVQPLPQQKPAPTYALEKAVPPEYPPARFCMVRARHHHQPTTIGCYQCLLCYSRICYRVVLRRDHVLDRDRVHDDQPQYPLWFGFLRWYPRITVAIYTLLRTVGRRSVTPSQVLDMIPNLAFVLNYWLADGLVVSFLFGTVSACLGV